MPFEQAQQAAREIGYEIDEEAARLVRLGEPLWEAIRQAQENIQKRKKK